MLTALNTIMCKLVKPNALFIYLYTFLPKQKETGNRVTKTGLPYQANSDASVRVSPSAQKLAQVPSEIKQAVSKVHYNQILS